MRTRHLIAVFAASTPLFLGGCVIPPAVTIGSYIADGISYVASGKSIEDHALSAITDQDCALHHLIQEKAICSDYAVSVELHDVAVNASPDAKSEQTTHNQDLAALSSTGAVALAGP